MNKVHEKLEELGIDQDRLSEVLTSKDNFGLLVHAFETVTVLGVVLDAWSAPDEKTPRIEAGTKIVLPDGQVREIADVHHVLDEGKVVKPSGGATTLVIELTDRWSPDVS